MTTATECQSAELVGQYPAPPVVQEFDSRLPWLEGRRKYIGSSDAAAILGCGYAGESRTSVWASKVHGVKKNWSKDDLERLEMGKIGEEFVIRMFGAKNPQWSVVSTGKFDLVVPQQHPFMCCTLDAKAVQDGRSIPLEAKVVNYQEWEWADGKCPLKYIVQVHHQMICLGTDLGCVIALVKGEYMERWIERDDRLVEVMLAEYQKFWQHVIDRTPPEDDSSFAYEAARPEVEYGIAKVIGKKLSDELRTLKGLLEESAKLEARIDRIKAQVAREVGGVEYLVLDDQTSVKLGKKAIKFLARLPQGVRTK